MCNCYDTFIVINFVIIISYYSLLSLQFYFYLITMILSDLSGGVLNQHYKRIYMLIAESIGR